MQETLNWMCEHMAFWYVDYGIRKEILYPITREKQDIVLSILDMRANALIYDNKFYSLSKDIIMTTDKASYTYYLKKSSYYKKQKALKMLPYNLDNSPKEIIKKLSIYYQHYNLPFILLVIESDSHIMSYISTYLNFITYLDLDEQKIINHADIYTEINKKNILFLSNSKGNNSNQMIIDKLKQKKVKFKIFQNDLSFFKEFK